MYRNIQHEKTPFFTPSIETVKVFPVNPAAVLHSQYTGLVLLQMETKRLLSLCALIHHIQRCSEKIC